MRWLYKLEYKHGQKYIRNLMAILVAGMGVVFVAQYLFSPYSIVQWLTLDVAKILQGQVWRLISFVFVPPNSSILWVFVSLYFYFILGRTLEQVWGGFRFNFYYFVGILGTILAAFASYFLTGVGIVGNSTLNLSLFLAVATIAPDYTIHLFFVLPLKAKWLGIAYAVLMVLDVVRAFIMSPMIGLSSLIVLVFCLANYLLFFGRSLVESIGNQIRVYQNRRNWRKNNRR